MKERKNFEKDERKQKYNSLSADNVNVTAEEYEACAALCVVQSHSQRVATAGMNGWLDKLDHEESLRLKLL